MAPFPEDAFVEAMHKLVQIDRDWIPDTPDGSLYLRPFMIANEAFLGVKPASEYLFVTIASAVGSYFKDPTGTVTVWISEHFTRAAPGGTGAAKCGGNYAASLAAQAEAARQGCEQVVFLDAAERRYIEELGGMKRVLRVRRRHAPDAAALRQHPARISRDIGDHPGPRGGAHRQGGALHGRRLAGRRPRRPAHRGLRLRHRRR